MQTVNKSISNAITLLNEGKAYSVFIDDTGSNNLDTENTTRFVGVVVPPEFSADIPFAIKKALESLNKTVKATEFHFSDIYQGQGEFRGVDLNFRLNLIKNLFICLVI